MMMPKKLKAIWLWLLTQASDPFIKGWGDWIERRWLQGGFNSDTAKMESGQVCLEACYCSRRCVTLQEARSKQARSNSGGARGGGGGGRWRRTGELIDRLIDMTDVTASGRRRCLGVGRETRSI